MNAIAEKVHLIERIAPHDDATLRILDNVIDFPLANDHKKLAGYCAELATFETQYGMSTAEFQRRFDSSELGDAPYWFDWDGLAAIAASLEAKLKSVESGCG